MLPDMIIKSQTLTVTVEGVTHTFELSDAFSYHNITYPNGRSSRHIMTPTETMLTKLVIAL